MTTFLMSSRHTEDERDEPTHEVVRLSWLASNRLLYLFALADTRSRDTDSMTRPEENLYFWKTMAEEVGCFDEPYPLQAGGKRRWQRQLTPHGLQPEAKSII